MATIVRKFRTAVRDPKLAVKFLRKYTLTTLSDLFWSIIAIFNKKGNPPPIKHLYANDHTPVDSFWSEHTVIAPSLTSAKTVYQSKRYLEWRFSIYPLFKEFMQLYGNHDDQVILDYGCGPGNDLVGFLIYTNAKKVIGIDTSEKALKFASQRLALHKVDPNRIELIHTSDSIDTLPIDDNTVDYIHCLGVLHHLSNPKAILREFHRILKPNSHACIMVYNCDSIWLHLYTAYEKMIIQNKFPGMNIYEAFSKTTDTEKCPIARCYRAKDFISICKDIGFNGEYVGGYLTEPELKSLKKYRQSALQDERLSNEHKNFLKDLVFDERGFPRYKGKHAGIGGVYRLYKKS